MSPARKRLYAIIIITVFCFIIVMGIGNFRAKQLAVEMAAVQIEQTMAIAVQQLDIGKMQKIFQTLDEKEPYYNEIREKFIKLKKEHNLADIFIIYKNSQSEWFHVVDAREQNDPAHSPLSKLEDQASGSIQRTLKGQAVRGEYHDTFFGAVVSSYQQIKDRQGNVIAVLGADFASEEITEFLFTTRYVQFGVIGVCLLLVCGVVLLTSPQKNKY